MLKRFLHAGHQDGSISAIQYGMLAALFAVASIVMMHNFAG
jgi:Flp pilus assembly pilin Flp